MSAPPSDGVSAVPGRRPLCFVNPWVDFLFIGGLSILAFVALRAFGGVRSDGNLLTLLIVLAFVCNWPHFAASACRLYESPEHVRQYPLTALLVPWLVLGGVVAAFLSPEVIAPYWIKLFILWSPYHFSGQTLGISLIYAHRGGYRIGRWQRLLLSTFIFGTFVSQSIRGEVGAQPDHYFGIVYPRFGLPDWRFPGREQNLLVDVATLITFVGGLGFLAIVLHVWARHKRRPPFLFFVPALAQYVWFVEGRWWTTYYEFVPFFHSLQYLFIAWAVRLKGRMDRGHVAPSLRYVLVETGRWGLGIFALGAAMFYGLPRIGTGLELLGATGILTAAWQIHHFFVDGVIWKLRSPSVSSPLMVNLDDLIRPPPSLATSASELQPLSSSARLTPMECSS